MWLALVRLKLMVMPVPSAISSV